MAEELNVDVDGLTRGSSDIGEQATALSASHRQSMIGLSDAETGWVGSSADALVQMADAWQQVADGHHAALTRQAGHIAKAAQRFQSSDEHSAAELEQLRAPSAQ
ncbi:MAG: WXG100 family type VII secretion target [Mycobacterium sp.]